MSWQEDLPPKTSAEDLKGAAVELARQLDVKQESRWERLHKGVDSGRRVYGKDRERLVKAILWHEGFVPEAKETQSTGERIRGLVRSWPVD